MTFNELKSKYNLKENRRDFCDIIERLREKGFAIGANRGGNGGYFRMVSEEERQIFIRQYRKQIQREITILQHIQQAALAE